MADFNRLYAALVASIAQSIKIEEANKNTISDKDSLFSKAETFIDQAERYLKNKNP